MAAGKRPFTPPAVGEPFIPYGVFDRTVVIPMSLLQHPTLSMGAAVLYGRLVLYRGARRDGFCCPSLSELAKSLSVSQDSIVRWIDELSKVKLIRSKRGGPGSHSERIFLWNEALRPSISGSTETAESRNQAAPSETADLHNEAHTETAESGSLKPQICGTETAESRFAYKEEKIHEKIHIKDSSSSSAFCSTPGPSDDDELHSFLERKTPEANPPEDWRTPEVVRDFSALLHSHKFRILTGEEKFEVGAGPLPDQPIAKRILAFFTDEDDCFNWFCDLEARVPTGRSFREYAVYETDAASWPERRADAAAVRMSNSAKQEEQHRQEEIQAEQYRQQQERARQEAEARERRAAAAPCLRCNNQGLVQNKSPEAPAIFAWCSCEHAEYARAEKGDDYPEILTAKAATEWEQRAEMRRFTSQTDRWVACHARLVARLGKAALMDLDMEFFGGSLDHRDEMLVVAESPTRTLQSEVA